MHNARYNFRVEHEKLNSPTELREHPISTVSGLGILNVNDARIDEWFITLTGNLNMFVFRLQQPVRRGQPSNVSVSLQHIIPEVHREAAQQTLANEIKVEAHIPNLSLHTPPFRGLVWLTSEVHTQARFGATCSKMEQDAADSAT